MRPALSIRYLTLDQQDNIYHCFVGDWGMTRTLEEPVNNYDEVLDIWERLWAEGQIGGYYVKRAILVEGGTNNGRQTLFGADKHQWNHKMPRIPIGEDSQVVLGPYWAGTVTAAPLALSNSSISPSGFVEEDDLLEVPDDTQK